MRIESPLVTHTIEHWNFRFVSGLPLDIDIDEVAGDTIDFGEDGQIDVRLADKISYFDGETKLAGKSYIIRTDQLAYIERTVRQVVDPTPEQQREQREMAKKLIEQAKTS